MKFEKIIRKTQSELKKYVASTLRTMNYPVIVKDGFVYAQGTHPVMLVAHLDTVHRTPVQHIMYTKKGDLMMSPQGIGGDDRCGVYMALKIAAKTRCHVLFCEDEEMGGVGANKFSQSGIVPDVKYIVEFDRRGNNDAVYYDCANEAFIEFVNQFGFEEEYGSFSDISFIAPELGIAAVNLSCGYYNPHMQYEYINIVEMENNIIRAQKMIDTNCPKFDYIEAVKSYTKHGSSGWYNTYYDDYSSYLGVKELPDYLFPLAGGEKKRDPNTIYVIGEDDHCYKYNEDFDVVVFYGEGVVTKGGDEVLYDDLAGDEQYLEEMDAKELHLMYEDIAAPLSSKVEHKSAVS